MQYSVSIHNILQLKTDMLCFYTGFNQQPLLNSVRSYGRSQGGDIDLTAFPRF